MNAVLHIAAWVLAAALLPGLVHLAALSLAALRPRRDAGAQPYAGSIELLVPAHNEAAVIRATASHLAQACARDGAARLTVVADNCEDATAAEARLGGARVLERRDPDVRGKGAALRMGFAHGEGADWIVVVDADSRIDAGFLPAMRLAIGAALDDSRTVALQARYLGQVPEAATGPAALRARLVSVAMLGFNVLRPRGRDAMGASCGLFGNGFAVRADQVRGGGWGSDAIVEDADQHLRWQAAGLRVRFVDGAVVRGELPLSGAGARSQRARWEGGRLALARQWLPALARALARRQGWAAEPLADFLLPPLGLLATGLAALALLPVPATRWVAAAGALALALHVALALWIGRADRRQVAALLAAPAYVAWKLAQLLPTLRAASGRPAWVRTRRNAEPDESLRAPQ